LRLKGAERGIVGKEEKGKGIESSGIYHKNVFSIQLT